MTALDGRWSLERTGGALPPLSLMRKRIEGALGWTEMGSVRFAFDVVDLELRYRFPLVGLVDVVSPDGVDAFAGDHPG